MGFSFHIPRGIRLEKVAPAWRDRADTLARFVATFRPDASTVLKAEGNSFVARAELEGVALVIKSRQLGTIRERAKSLLRASRGFRQWRGARRLQRAGIPVARPIALLTQHGVAPAEAAADARSLPLVHTWPREWLLLEEAPGKTLLHHLADRDLSVRDEHALARAVGVQVGAMLRANVCNRDHKPSNLIVTFDEGVPIVTLIDTVGIRRRGNPGEMARMLATLLIEPIGVGVPPRSAVAYRVLRDACAAWLEHTLARPLGAAKGDRKALRSMVRSMARRVDQYIRTHGDPTPKVNPLA
ncbi:MAG TPA: hypothetical protein VF777_13115 [Phycisphaerales bacterium]